MELYENRIFNGILKEVENVETPQMAEALLTHDIEIYVDPRRKGADDLWPCVCALTVALSKQFTGTIFVRFGSSEPPDAPTTFSSRIAFCAESSGANLRIGLGAPPPGNGHSLWGDVRGNRIGFGHSLDPKCGEAHPIACFALAGYLGFAALAQAVGIPPFREEFTETELNLPFLANGTLHFPEDGIGVLGLGQLGQAYLALLFFLAKRSNAFPSVFLLDKDTFEPPNEFTQLLLTDNKDWNGAAKAPYLAEKVKAWGWNSSAERQELTWGFRKGKGHPRLAILGFDDFEPRRIAIESGYEWILDAGIGTSFVKPRITWHSLPPDRKLASRIFGHRAEEDPELNCAEKTFFAELRRTPGQCGWITFKNVRASAPSMGLVAAAYAWAEMMSVLDGNHIPIAGAAYLWSPLLPFFRDFLLVHA